MPMYSVMVRMSISAVVEVEAETPEEAIELAYDSSDMPGGITIGAFGSASVDEDGEWEPWTVTDEDGRTVWSEGLDISDEA
jgi:hypothetical protein